MTTNTTDLPELLNDYLTKRALRFEAAARLDRAAIIDSACATAGGDDDAETAPAQEIFDRVHLADMAAERALKKAILTRTDRTTVAVRIGAHLCVLIDEEDAREGPGGNVVLHLAVFADADIIDLSPPASKEADA